MPLANAERIRERVASAHKALQVLEHSGHVLPVDVERAAVAGLAVEFFSGLERRSRH